MSKIENDKYYTSKDLAEYVVNKTKGIIGYENIIEYIEPSAGAGVFLDLLDKPYLAYDIHPEDEKIREQDFLTLNLDYKKGRCIIGNPPYGRVNNLATQFFKKSITLGDYISFILPISQLNNTIKLYEFDLIYSEDLGVRNYSNKPIHCCLNIYKRPVNGLNKKQNYNLKDVTILEGIRGGGNREKKITKESFNYDVAICAWGSSLGKEIEYEGQYAQEFYIKVNKREYVEKVLMLIKNVNWYEVYNMTATPKLQLWKVYKYIKEKIPEIV